MSDTQTVALQDFDFDSINPKEDAVGFAWDTGLYILKGFRLDTNNYTCINIPVPRALSNAIADEVLHR